MLIRFRDWATDGLPTRTIYLDNEQLVFEDDQQGMLDVRRKEHIEALLRDESRDFEIAYEAYGVAFDETGRQVDAGPSDADPPTVTDDDLLPDPATARPLHPAAAAPRRRGRPPKRR